MWLSENDNPTPTDGDEDEGDSDGDEDEDEVDHDGNMICSTRRPNGTIQWDEFERPQHHWHLCVITRYGEEIGIGGWLEPWTEIRDVKLLVEQMTDLTAEQQRLIFAGTELDDNRTLASYGITDGSTFRQEALHGSVGGIDIEVMIVLGCVWCPPQLKLEWVSPCETIGWVKEMIEARTKFPKDQQRLMRRSGRLSLGRRAREWATVDCVAISDDEDARGMPELEDHRTLLSYGITYSSTDEMVCELPDKHTLKVLMGRAGAGTPLRDSTPPLRKRARYYDRPPLIVGFEPSFIP